MYHLCSRISEHISRITEKPECSQHSLWNFNYLSVPSKDGDQEAPGMPFTLKKSVLIQWDSTDHVLTEGLMHLSCMGTMPWLFLYTTHCLGYQLNCQEALTLKIPCIGNDASLEVHASMGSDWSQRHRKESEADRKMQDQSKILSRRLCPRKQKCVYENVQ